MFATYFNTIGPVTGQYCCGKRKLLIVNVTVNKFIILENYNFIFSLLFLCFTMKF